MCFYVSLFFRYFLVGMGRFYGKVVLLVFPTQVIGHEPLQYSGINHSSLWLEKFLIQSGNCLERDKKQHLLLTFDKCQVSSKKPKNTQNQSFFGIFQGNLCWSGQRFWSLLTKRSFLHNRSFLTLRAKSTLNLLLLRVSCQSTGGTRNKSIHAIVFSY